MMPLEDLRTYLPKYLSAENFDQLIAQLRDYPANIHKRMFTSGLEPDIIYQGDALNNMPVVEIEHLDYGVKHRPCMVVSNTCDMDVANKRMYPTRIVYTPLIDLGKYEKLLAQYGYSEEKISNHISDVKSQRISNMFYLPSTGDFGESIVFLDRLLNVSQNYVDRNEVQSKRLFSLSDYGFYLFVFKLSIHFSRIREGVNRGAEAE